LVRERFGRNGVSSNGSLDVGPPQLVLAEVDLGQPLEVGWVPSQVVVVPGVDLMKPFWPKFTDKN
jgi:hypothetical protein